MREGRLSSSDLMYGKADSFTAQTCFGVSMLLAASGLVDWVTGVCSRRLVVTVGLLRDTVE